jgi:hypothetical protein
VALGQWSAGKWFAAARPSNHPIGFEDFDKDMRAVVEIFQRLGLRLYLRNIHYNPLGDLRLRCPASDWRVPPVIDMYNAILQNISVEMGVPYIDGSSILGPIWDTALDWCHYRNDGAMKEALHILSSMLSGGAADSVVSDGTSANITMV